MLTNFITITIALIYLTAATFFDIKTREIPDFLTYSLIFIAIAFSSLNSIFQRNPILFFHTIIIFIAMIILVNLLYYAKLWGGGDSKLLIGLGTLFSTYPQPHHFLLIFLANLLIIGAFYTLFYSIFLAIKNKNKFTNKLKDLFKKQRLTRIAFLLLTIFLLIISFFIQFSLLKSFFYITALFTLTAPYILIFTKAVESSSMFKQVDPEKLTEGDWLVKDIIINKKIICSSKKPGLEKKDIQKLIELKKAKKLQRILIKEGIPFIPVFLIAFITTIISNNLVTRIMGF